MKHIKLTEKNVDAILKKIRTNLLQNKFSGGSNTSINLMPYLNIKAKTAKCEITFSTTAKQKLISLIEACPTEIGWHGTVERTAKGFHIKDIFVYPQTVTGATTTTDEAEYTKWLQELDDDTFNTLRMQGHSHVNFTASPSGVDEQMYADILQTLTENDFYIFMIHNKRGDIYIRIYDYPNNILYENADVTIETISQTTWAEEQLKKYISRPINKVPKQTTLGNYHSGSRIQAYNEQRMFSEDMLTDKEKEFYGYY